MNKQSATYLISALLQFCFKREGGAFMNFGRAITCVNVDEKRAHVL